MRTRYTLNSDPMTFLDLVEHYRLDELIIPQSNYRGEWPSEHYGDWDQVKEHTPLDPAKVFLLPKYTSGSDYSGSLVEVSNHAVLCELLEAEGLEEGKDWVRYCGGHGTFAVGVRVGAITEAVRELLDGLDDYPLADESDHSHRELDAQEESWKDWARSDFKRELEKQAMSWLEATLGDQDGGYEQSEWDLINWVKDGEWVDSVDDRIDQWAWGLVEVTNTDWENEQGSDCYLDVERVAKGVWDRLADHVGDWTKGKQAEVRREVEASVIRGWELAYWDGIKGIAG